MNENDINVLIRRIEMSEETLHNLIQLIQNTDNSCAFFVMAALEDLKKARVMLIGKKHNVKVDVDEPQ